MTVSTTNTKNTYTADGATSSFAFSFRVLAETDLLVQVVDDDGIISDKDLGTHYTVTGTGNSEDRTNYTSGTIIFDAAYIPANTYQVIVRRDIPLLQGTDYIENDTFPAETHEEALDKLTLITQQMQEQIDRSFKADYTGTDSTDFSLPNPVANYYLRFNSDASGLEAVANTGTIGLDNVADDPSPDLGGHLNVNNKEIVSLSNGDVTIQPHGTGKINLLSDTLTIESEIAHYGDLDNKIVLGSDSQTIYTGGSSRLDITNSGLRLGGANARVTTIDDDYTLAANSGNRLPTQHAVYTFVNDKAVLADGPIVRANLDMDGYSIVTNDSNESITIDPHGAGNINLVADTGGVIVLNADVVRVNQNLTANSDPDTGFVWNTANSLQVFTGNSARALFNNSGLNLGSTGATVSVILDEDDMISNSATALVTQQSSKAYADGRYTAAVAAAVAQIPAVATQAQMEASTAGVYVSPSVFRYHPASPKSWAMFTMAGAIPISYGVTSITTISSSVVRVNVTQSMITTNNNCVQLSSRDASATTALRVRDTSAGWIEINSTVAVSNVYITIWADN